MKLCEIFLVKPARFEQHHGQRVTQRQHHSRARSRGEVQRTCFLFDVYVEKQMHVLGESGSRIAAHGDDPDLKPCDRGQDPEQLLRLPTRA
jgi:hypothetical protein